jgi:hypothetical protein
MVSFIRKLPKQLGVTASNLPAFWSVLVLQHSRSEPCCSIPSSIRKTSSTDPRQVLPDVSRRGDADGKVGSADAGFDDSVEASKGRRWLRVRQKRAGLFQRITDKSMPPTDGKVTDDEARIIRDWIDGGAKTAEAVGSGQGQDREATTGLSNHQFARQFRK